MFQKGDKVIYPIHGLGKIVKIDEIEFDGEEQKYYKLKFPNKTLNISVPAETAEEIGLRKPLSKKDLKDTLEDLLKKKRFKKRNYSKINDASQELLNSGTTEDAVRTISMIYDFKRRRKKDGKSLTTSSRTYLKKAKAFLKQEVEHVLGKKALKTYGLD